MALFRTTKRAHFHFFFAGTAFCSQQLLLLQIGRKKKKKKKVDTRWFARRFLKYETSDCLIPLFWRRTPLYSVTNYFSCFAGGYIKCVICMQDDMLRNNPLKYGLSLTVDKLTIQCKTNRVASVKHVLLRYFLKDCCISFRFY